jgi:RNA polymerase sigma-70 factor (ECF subfamily)
LDDYSLIRSIANQDMQAFEFLYQKYYADVYRFAYMVVKNEDIAEDTAQSVFLKISKCAHQFRGTGSVKSWIIKITRSIYLNVIKHNSYCENYSAEELTKIASTENDFEGIELLSVLEGLSPEMMEIVVLRVAYRFRHNEIARMMSKSPDSVRQQYKRAMSILKKRYTNNSFSERSFLL